MITRICIYMVHVFTRKGWGRVHLSSNLTLLAAAPRGLHHNTQRGRNETALERIKEGPVVRDRGTLEGLSRNCPGT